MAWMAGKVGHRVKSWGLMGTLDKYIMIFLNNQCTYLNGKSKFIIKNKMYMALQKYTIFSVREEEAGSIIPI